ncbi:MAG: type II toxin-antitoxin system PemK/MazF family toxin [Helicobacteraceae bacterium]|jgi:uncharacterized protein YifN (PemK superfamily)|nr:type II toxin-antitoxin system PemK/MazF family toxin [Helicobacteraceae bacterium]
MAFRAGEVKRWRVALTHFGVLKRESALDEYKEEALRYGIALGNEFARKHYAIIVDNNEQSHTAIVVPITSRKPYDNERLYAGDITLNPDEHGLKAFLSVPSIAKTDCIRQVSHERFIKVVPFYISTTLRDRIRKAVNYAMCDSSAIDKR